MDNQSIKNETTTLEFALILLEKAKLELPKLGKSNLIRFYTDTLESIQRKLKRYALLTS